MSVDLDTDDRDFRAAIELHRRRISEEQLRKFEGYMAEIFTAFGMAGKAGGSKAGREPFVSALCV